MIHPLTRRTLVGAATAAGLLSGCALGVQGVARERNAVRIESVSFRLFQARFRLPEAEKHYAAAIGIDDGSFYAETGKTIVGVLALMGIRSSATAPYVLTVTPEKYRVQSQGAIGGYRRAMVMQVSLQRVGDPEPMWTGTHTMHLTDDPRDGRPRAQASLWTAQLLKALEAAAVIAPRPPR